MRFTGATVTRIVDYNERESHAAGNPNSNHSLTNYSTQNKSTDSQFAREDVPAKSAEPAQSDALAEAETEAMGFGLKMQIPFSGIQEVMAGAASLSLEGVADQLNS